MNARTRQASDAQRRLGALRGVGAGRQRDPDLEGSLHANAVDLQGREQAYDGLGCLPGHLDRGLVGAWRSFSAGIEAAADATHLAARRHAGDRARRDACRGQLARRYGGLLCGEAQQLGRMVSHRHACMVAKCTT